MTTSATGSQSAQPAAGARRAPAVAALASMAAVASVAWWQLTSASICTNQSAAKAMVGMLESAVDMYGYQVGEYPEGLSDLVTAPQDQTKAERWQGPYINKPAVPVDPWGHEYRCFAPGKHNRDKYDVWSVGPDGKDQTRDDIGNWPVRHMLFGPF